MAAAPPVDATEPRPARPGRRRARRIQVAVAVVVVLVGAGLATAWTLGARSVPMPMGGGWWSEDMESATVQGLTESHVVFRCEPGHLEAEIDLVNDGPVSVTVTDVRVPMLDDLLGDGRVVRSGTQMMRDPAGDLYDRVEFRPARAGGGGWPRLFLTWEVRECPQLAPRSYMIEDRVEVTYEAFGMTHTATVPLPGPMALTSTSTPLDPIP